MARPDGTLMPEGGASEVSTDRLIQIRLREVDSGGSRFALRNYFDRPGSLSA